MKSFVKNTLTFLLLILILSGCSFFTSIIDPDVSFNSRNIIPLNLKSLTSSTLGNPKSYVVYSKTYTVLETSKGYSDTGSVSIYPNDFNNQETSSGEEYYLYKLTAASRTLPLPCYVNILNHTTGKSINVLVNDRGPFNTNAIVKISQAVAYRIGIKETDLASTTVTVQAIKPYTSISRSKNYYIQFAIFSSIEKANKVNSYLKSIFNFNNSKVVELNTQGAGIYAIGVGPFNTKAMAKIYMDKNLNALPMLPSIVEE